MLKKYYFKCQIKMHLLLLILFSLSPIFNQLSAQKIRKINRFDENKELAIKYVEFDTLNIKFNVSS